MYILFLLVEVFLPTESVFPYICLMFHVGWHILGSSFWTSDGFGMAYGKERMSFICVGLRQSVNRRQLALRMGSSFFAWVDCSHTAAELQRASAVDFDFCGLVPQIEPVSLIMMFFLPATQQ